MKNFKIVRLISVIGLGLLLLSPVLNGCSTPAPTTSAPPASTSAPPTSAAPSTSMPASPKASTTTAAPPAAIELKVVSFVPVTLAVVAKFKDYAANVNSKNAGVKINWLGGPEVITANTLVEAIRAGRIDMALVPLNWFRNDAPETVAGFLSEWTPMEERKNGLFDYLQTAAKKANVYALGRVISNRPTYMFSRGAITKLSDLSGKKISYDGPQWKTTFEALGMVWVQVRTLTGIPALNVA